MNDQPAATTTIHVVDDDASFRTALARLLRVHGHAVALHASAAEFLAAAPYGPGAVLLDVDLPGCSGPELQARLATRADVPPIVFLTGKGDIAGSVKAIKAGAEDYLTKPVEAAELLDALSRALDRDAQRGVVLDHGDERAHGAVWPACARRDIGLWCRSAPGAVVSRRA